MADLMNSGVLIDGDGTPDVNNAPDANAGKMAALAYGITQELLNEFPELKPIYDLFIAERYAEARLAYYASEYYKNFTNTSKARRTTKAAQPGVYAQELQAYQLAQFQRLRQKGIAIDNKSFVKITQEAYDKGYSDLQVDAAVLNSGALGDIGGSTLGKVNLLKDYANSAGVNQFLSPDYWQKQSVALFSGAITEDDIEEDIKNMSASAYPAYAQGILAGKSFDVQTSALRQMLANTLEVDVDTITNNNPVFKQIVNYVDPKTKQPSVMPIWEAERVAKSTEQWLYTDNARDTIDTLSLKVLRDWGLA